MEQVYEMDGLRVVDLTKTLDPKTETRRCWLWRYNTGGPIPDYHTIMDLTSHLGTHCECPYHHDDSWPSVAGNASDVFLGPCVVCGAGSAGKPSDNRGGFGESNRGPGTGRRRRAVG